LIEDAHTTTDYKFEGQAISAEVLVDDLNASFSEYELPGRKANVVTTVEAFA
jgi:hypothetical protein